MTNARGVNTPCSALKSATVQLRGNESSPLFCEKRGHHAAVVGVSFAFHQTHVFHAIEQSRDIGHTRDQPIAQFIPTQPARLGTAQNAQHVVLRTTETIRLEQLVECVLQQGMRAHEIQMRFLLEALYYACYNTYCQDTYIARGARLVMVNSRLATGGSPLDTCSSLFATDQLPFTTHHSPLIARSLSLRRVRSHSGVSRLTVLEPVQRTCRSEVTIELTDRLNLARETGVSGDAVQLAYTQEVFHGRHA